MKMKTISLACILYICAYSGISQNGVYAEYKLSQDNMVGAMLPSLISKICATESTVYSTVSSKRIRDCYYLYESSGLTIKNEETGECMNDTWENVDTAAKEYGVMRLSNISLVKVTGDTTLLGHTCKKAIMRFTQTTTTSKLMQSSQSVTSTIWYTLDFKNYAFKGLQDPSYDAKEYNEALSNLEGAIMYIDSETEVMLGIKVRGGTICTKIENMNITTEQQRLELKNCLKTMTAKEYSKLVRKRTQRSMNRGF